MADKKAVELDAFRPLVPRRRISFLLALLAWALPMRALDPRQAISQYIHKTWTSQSGLPQNSVYALAQTPDGYLWMGTEEGLVRFDGSHFEVFNRLNTKGLPDNFVTSLGVGRDGVLWIDTRSGIVRAKSIGRPQFQMVDHISDLCSDCRARSGNIWFPSSQGVIHARNGPVERLTKLQGLPTDDVEAVVQDKAGTLWMGTRAGLVEDRNGEFRTYTTREGLADNKVKALAVSPDGSLWIGGFGCLSEFKNGKFSTWSKSSHLPEDRISAMIADRDGNVWLGFDHHGIARLHEGHFDFYAANRGLPSDSITALFEDLEGNLWIGTLDQGVTELRESTFANFGVPEGLSSNVIMGITEGADGSIWAATPNSGVNRLTNDRVTVFSEKNGMQNGSAWGLLAARDGSMWVGLNDGWISHFQSGRWESFHSPFSRGRRVQTLLEDPGGGIWFGCIGSPGLGHLRNGRFQLRSMASDVNVLIPSQDGGLWVGTEDGFSHFRNGELTMYTSRQGLAGDHVYAMYEDPKGVLWIGSSPGGLSRFEGGHFTAYSVAQGLFDETVASLLEQNGDLWMTSNKGVFRAHKHELDDFAAGRIHSIHTQVYGLSDGLRSNECNYGGKPASWKGRDGKLWFPTVGGIAMYDPARQTRRSSPPHVLIERVLFDQQDLPLANGDKIGPGLGRLEFHYAAPTFVAPEQIQFRYRLQGFDHDWISAGTQRVAYYTNVPAGRYTFRVEAYDVRGLWRTADATISFRLKPRFRQTPWFFALCGLASLLAVYFGYKLRIRFLLRRNQELEERVSARTAELLAAAMELEQEKLELLRTREELVKLATRDGLTGLWNRKTIFDFLRSTLDRCARSGSPVSVIMCDLDEFKPINDRRGHQAGDLVLQEISRKLAEFVRTSDYVGRYGGEEFLIILPDCEMAEAVERAEQLRREIERTPVFMVTGWIEITCSFGVSSTSGECAEHDRLVQCADEALYRAKRAGRNRVECGETVRLS